MNAVLRANRYVRWTIDLFLLAYLSIIPAIAVTGGFTFSLGTIRLTAYSYTNPLLAVTLLLALRLWMQGAAFGRPGRRGWSRASAPAHSEHPIFRVATAGLRERLADGPAELWVFAALSMLVLVIYAVAGPMLGLVSPDLTLFGVPASDVLFGVSQLSRLGPIGTAGVLFAIVVGIALCTQHATRLESVATAAQTALYARRLRLVVAASLSAAVFFLFRNEYLNPDGLNLDWKLRRDVPALGAHITHDEMWELFLHSRFWFYTNTWWDWSVKLSYQVLSSLAGGVFVYTLLRYCRLVTPDRAILLFVLVVSGGFMQLFFGDVENYTLTAALVMGYFYASAVYLKHGGSLVPAALTLAVAMTFHLLAGFLLPSLAFLYLLELRQRRFGSVIAGCAAMGAVMSLTLAFFHVYGLPISNLYYHSHAFGHGGNIGAMLAAPSALHYVQQLSLLTLLAPVWVLLVPLAVFSRISLDPFNLHLTIATGFMLLLQFTWNPTLGVYPDWNLFAIGAIPLSLLVGKNLLTRGPLNQAWGLQASLVALFALHSYIWIIGNHYL